MKTLDKKEMIRITGGGISLGGIFAIGSLITFLAGVIDGFTRPLKCN